jgi:hypothetical protein
MSVTLWLDTEAEETIELGPTLHFYAAFAEIARAAGERWLDDYPDLASLADQCESQEDADPGWLAGVRQQALCLLAAYGKGLSADARGILETRPPG